MHRKTTISLFCACAEKQNLKVLILEPFPHKYYLIPLAEKGIPSFRILLLRVLGLIPRSWAAPFCPEIFPFVMGNARRICSLMASSRVGRPLLNEENFLSSFALGVLL